MKSHIQKTSVLIADDHELLRESLTLILGRESSIDIVGAVSDWLALLKAVATLQPAVVMMDLALPRINGIEAARRIRETVPGTGVIILSAHDRAEYMKEFLKEDSAGTAYLLKESLNSTRDLVRTIQDVAVGRTVLDPVMVSKLTSSPNVQINSSLKGLTSRELQVLSHRAGQQQPIYSGGAVHPAADCGAPHQQHPRQARLQRQQRAARTCPRRSDLPGRNGTTAAQTARPCFSGKRTGARRLVVTAQTCHQAVQTTEDH